MLSVGEELGRLRQGLPGLEPSQVVTQPTGNVGGRASGEQLTSPNQRCCVHVRDGTRRGDAGSPGPERVADRHARRRHECRPPRRGAPEPSLTWALGTSGGRLTASPGLRHQCPAVLGSSGDLQRRHALGDPRHLGVEPVGARLAASPPLRADRRADGADTTAQPAASNRLVGFGLVAPVGPCSAGEPDFDLVEGSPQLPTCPRRVVAVHPAGPVALGALDERSGSTPTPARHGTDGCRRSSRST